MLAEISLSRVGQHIGCKMHMCVCVCVCVSALVFTLGFAVRDPKRGEFFFGSKWAPDRQALAVNDL